MQTEIFKKARSPSDNFDKMSIKIGIKFEVTEKSQATLKK